MACVTEEEAHTLDRVCRGVGSLQEGAEVREIVRLLEADIARRVVRCRRCLAPVEVIRFCWVEPMCYACLPPPPELKALFPKERTTRDENQDTD